MNQTLHLRALWALVLLLATLQLVTMIARDPQPDAPPPVAFDPRLVELTGRLRELERGFAEISKADGEIRVPVATESTSAVAALTERIAILEAALPAAANPTGTGGRTDAEERELIGRLTAALAGGNHREVERLLALGLDVNRRDENRQTPLAAAAVAGQLEDIDSLLAHGARLERTAQRGMTPVLASLDAGQEDAALRLLDRGANLHAVDKNGEGVLMWAAFNGLERVVARAIRTGAKIDHQAHDGASALIDAARRGHLAIVQRLLQAGADPNLADKAGRTALARALDKGHTEIAELLRRHGGR